VGVLADFLGRDAWNKDAWNVEWKARILRCAQDDNTTTWGEGFMGGQKQILSFVQDDNPKGKGKG